MITSKLGGPFQNTYMVRGRVRNEGAAPIGRLRVEIRLKSETGKVVATFPAECPLTLGPGEEGEYRGVYRADNVTVIHGFEVVAEDLEAEEPAPTPWTPADSAEDGAATGEQAPGAEGASGAEAALATLERAKDEIERAIRDRVSRFLRARSPRILHCPRCKGRAVTACDPCAGRGRRVVSDGQRTWTRSCVDCRGSGTVACSQETCAKGYRNLSLRRAFWDVLSPTALNKRDRRAFYDELANGTWSATFGPSLVVEDAEILAVTVHADRVLVEVRGTWSPAPDQLGLTPRPPLWTSVWIRERENFYLATDADSAPEPLFDSD